MKNIFANKKSLLCTGLVLMSVVSAGCSSAGVQDEDAALSQKDADSTVETEYVSSSANESATAKTEVDGMQEKVYAQGTFDNLMGYSGYYVYYEDIMPVDGYYYADDGTLLARVWGVNPEDVGFVDFDNDGKNELISTVMYGDGVYDVLVYSEFEDGIKLAYPVEDLFSEHEQYEATGLGSLMAEYLKDTNEIKVEYWISEEQGYKSTTIPIDFEALTWSDADWILQ